MLTRSQRLLMAAVLCATAAGCSLITPQQAARQHRNELSLDGKWQVAEGSMDKVPGRFDHEVPVPGLLSLATPPFIDLAPKVKDRRQVAQKDPRRDAFWYSRRFQWKGDLPKVATLRVGKAMFGTRVYLNGKLLGDHAPCFTAGFFDAAPALRRGANTLVIRVGADREAVTGAVPSGFDFEKERYIPGIFDSVKLITSGTPNFVELQIAPDITNAVARVQAILTNNGPAVSTTVKLVVREARSGRVAGQTNVTVAVGSGMKSVLTASIPVPHCQLWSPENPFLYTLQADTESDSFSTRFGMREFGLDHATGRAVLNGKPYFMRGSNITLYRFFEDPDCGNLPWDAAWVRKLHRRIKDMDWNALRYCIGFPPERWYEIADEEGILIQDEFPIWFGASKRGTWPADLKTPELALEYAEWMRERWNHPCVVIWDADNETVSDQTGPAIREVRSLDLSDRPWDNGYEPPQLPSDVFESHPYHFNNPNFKLSQLEKVDRVPKGSVRANEGKNPVIINEYGWLWLNRDGTPTTLTSNLYVNLLGTNSTTAQRRHLYARYLAAETEFWRAHRKAAGVLHFTALGYSRPDGQTSDHWLNIKTLEWEPEFYKYVRDSFAPVGLMIDYWRDRVLGGTNVTIDVIAINDLPEQWRGDVTLTLSSGGREMHRETKNCTLPAYETGTLQFAVQIPKELGEYQLEAMLKGPDGREIRSLRDFKTVSRETFGAAEGRPVSASSTYADTYAPANAVDGDLGSYWSSAFEDNAWIKVDLEAQREISRVVVHWERAFSKAFRIQVSANGQSWTDIYKTENGRGGVTEATFAPTKVRWVRVVSTRRGTDWGNAICELEVF